MRHAAPVVFPVDFDSGEHIYRVHPINVQLVTGPVIMPVKEEHGCDSGVIGVSVTGHVIGVSAVTSDGLVML